MPKNKKIKQKHLCKYGKKDVEGNLKELALLVSEAKFICTKCARAAKTEEIQCQTKSIY